MKALLLTAALLLPVPSQSEVSQPTTVPTLDAICVMLRSGLSSTGIAATCRAEADVLLAEIHEVDDGDLRSAVFITAGSASLVARATLVKVDYIAVKVAPKVFLWTGHEPARCWDLYGEVNDTLLYDCIAKAAIK